ncbi:hypothetical protein B0H65DRAFT_133247 [Neurospora tetraspora]|uniref:Uncharacterized protein n=1 Tax=Neurospora tetraspora TaxID=94610 RepID=A0AAE0MUQ6_9PEZI|nr:hypothetical protein B0H65DRAFT_133247 [Neurospora tetraspora]
MSPFRPPFLQTIPRQSRDHKPSYRVVNTPDQPFKPTTHFKHRLLLASCFRPLSSFKPCRFSIWLMGDPAFPSLGLIRSHFTGNQKKQQEKTRRNVRFVMIHCSHSGLCSGALSQLAIIQTWPGYLIIFPGSLHQSCCVLHSNKDCYQKNHEVGTDDTENHAYFEPSVLLQRKIGTESSSLPFRGLRRVLPARLHSASGTGRRIEGTTIHQGTGSPSTQYR